MYRATAGDQQQGRDLECSKCLLCFSIGVVRRGEMCVQLILGQSSAENSGWRPVFPGGRCDTLRKRKIVQTSAELIMSAHISSHTHHRLVDPAARVACRPIVENRPQTIQPCRSSQRTAVFSAVAQHQASFSQVAAWHNQSAEE